jgi:hypothetical protein
MINATTKQYSVSLTNWFAEAVPYREAGLEGIAKKLLRKFSGYGLRPLEIFQRAGDRLFDYDLTFSLFNRNSTFRLTAEGSHAAFQNALGDKDAGVITDCLLGFLDSLSERRTRESNLEAFVHASLGSAEERDRFLRTLGATDRKISVAGLVLYSPADETFQEARFLVDRSLALPDGVFLNWAARFSEPLTQEVLTKAVSSFKRLSDEIGLEFVSPQAS